MTWKGGAMEWIRKNGGSVERALLIVYGAMTLSMLGFLGGVYGKDDPIVQFAVVGLSRFGIAFFLVVSAIGMRIMPLIPNLSRIYEAPSHLDYIRETGNTRSLRFKYYQKFSIKINYWSWWLFIIGSILYCYYVVIGFVETLRKIVGLNAKPLHDFLLWDSVFESSLITL